MPDVAPQAAPVRSKRTLLWVLTSYFGEGLPWSLLHQLVTEFLTATRASKTQIGATSLFHLAVTFKFAWSPLVDLFGKRRTWFLALQVLFGLGMFGVAALTDPGKRTIFWVALGALAIVHATHDVACDGYYLQALDKVGQALYAGVRVTPFRAAQAVVSSGLLLLAARTSWSNAFAAGGVLMILVGLLNAVVVPRIAETHASLAQKKEGPSPAPGEKLKTFWAAYASFFTQPRAPLVLAFMFLYRLGDIMMFAMSKPMLLDIGVDSAHRSYLNGLGLLSTIVGSIGAGVVVARIGIARCLLPMMLVQNLSIPLYIGLAVFKPHFGAIVAGVVFEQFAAGIGTTAQSVYLMQRCRTAFSAAHFAFATAVVSLGSTLSGFASGPINEAVGHPKFFTIAFLASFPGLILAFFVPKTDIEGDGPVTVASDAAT